MASCTVLIFSGCKSQNFANPKIADDSNTSVTVPATPGTSPITIPAPSPTPSMVDGVPVPNHAMSFGYYFTDGKYGDFQKEVDCYSDLYIAVAKNGYAKSSDDTDDMWLADMERSVNRAASKKQKIVWTLSIDATGPVITSTLIRMMNFMEKIWPHVYMVELADEPKWTKAETESKLKEVRNFFRSRGVQDKPLGIVYTQSQSLDENAITAQGLDWVGLEAYVDPPGDSNSKVNVDKLNIFLKRAKARIPPDKNIVIVMQAYSRNFGWKDINTLKELQMPAYNHSYNDPRVIALMMFAYGRPSGTRDNLDLRPIHRKMGNAVLNKQCQPGD